MLDQEFSTGFVIVSVFTGYSFKAPALFQGRLSRLKWKDGFFLFSIPIHRVFMGPIVWIQHHLTMKRWAYATVEQTFDERDWVSNAMAILSCYPICRTTFGRLDAGGPSMMAEVQTTRLMFVLLHFSFRCIGPWKNHTGNGDALSNLHHQGVWM